MNIKDLNFKNNNKYSKLDVGYLVYGFTYSEGDYHTMNEAISDRFFGEAKLRLGIIVEKYSENYFKVQFRNSAAMKSINKRITNSIKILSDIGEMEIKGTDSYCIIINKKRLVRYCENTSLVGDINIIKQLIFSKHSYEKRRVETWFKKLKFVGAPREKINKYLFELQFTKRELFISNVKALEKVKLIWFKHYHFVYKCVYHELRKTISLIKFLNNNENVLNIVILIVESIIMEQKNIDNKIKNDEIQKELNQLK